MITNLWGWRPWRRGWGWRGGPVPVYPAMEQPVQVPEGALPLERVPSGTKVKVVAVIAGTGATNRIYQMGIVPGSIIEVVDNNLMYPWTPVLVRVHGMTIALGRGLASKILVLPLHALQQGETAGEDRSGIREES